MRHFENVVCDAAPAGMRSVARNDGKGLFEESAVNPQFAVKLERGKLLGEPSGGGKPATLARQQLSTIPIGPYAIELLAHVPPADIHSRPVLRQQQEIRRLSM